jgi:hypothetical protein
MRFRQMAWSASLRLGRPGSRLIEIPALRRALSHVPPSVFDAHLLRLERNGVAYLVPPDRPASLSEIDRREALAHPAGDLRWFVLWLEPKGRASAFWD